MAGTDHIEKLLKCLTLEEKCRLLAGKNMWETCDVPRLGIRSLKTTDGPAGVRGATWIDGTHTTFIPCGISLAATFNTDLVERVGSILGQEARSKNAHVLLAPTMNMSRSPLGGRNFENFGEDPFLTGKMATSYIKGVQKHGVGACMKHFVANDMETRRFNMDQQIDHRTLREMYLRPFEMALDAEPWTAMASYPKINGEHADCSSFLLKETLRGEWGFDNLVMCDWGGLNDTCKSIIAGTDLEMPGPPIRYGQALLAAVKAGQVSEQEHVDRSVRRLLKLLAQAGLLHEDAGQNSSVETGSDLPEFRRTAREAASDAIVLLKNQGVLPLELQSVKTLAIIGPNADKPTAGGTGSAAVNPYYITTPTESISKAAKEINPDITIVTARGITTSVQPSLLGDMLKTPDGHTTGLEIRFYRGHEFTGPVIGISCWQNSVVFMMSDGDTPDTLRGKPHCYQALGIFQPTISGKYDFSLSSTGKAKLFVDDKLLIDNYEWKEAGGTFMNCGSVNRIASLDLESGRQYKLRVDNIVEPPPLKPHDNTLFHTLSGLRIGMQLRIDEQALFDKSVSAAQDADAVVLVVGHNNDTEKEGVDRISLELPRRTNEFVEAVCAVNRSTVVVTQSACAVAMPWVDSASAIVHAWYQGQENGNALADVLVNRVNPSGKLPITFPRRLEDHGSHKYFPGDVENDYAEFREGVLIGYRWFDAQDIAPLWPFGFGLSYTTFEICDVRVDGNSIMNSGDATSEAIISVTIHNTGRYNGSEVVQVYTSPSSAITKKGLISAPRSLAGFSKVYVPSGKSKDVQITLSLDSFRWFDTEGSTNSSYQGVWRVDKGKYQCFVGTGIKETQTILEIDVE